MSEADERVVMDAELAEEHARMVAERARAEPGWPSEWPEPFAPPEPIAFQAEAEPAASDAVVLRDLAHVLERGGDPYGWIPNRLRTIAARLEAMDASEFVEEAAGWP